MRLIRASVPAISLFACVPSRMQVPPELARDGELLEATDRTNISGGLFDENFRLGPYAVTDVHRQGNSSESFAIALVDSGESAGFEYNLFHGKTALKGSCRSAQRAKTFACSCASRTATATLSMQDVAGTFEGVVTTSAGRYRVTSIHELEGGAQQNEPSGYRIDGSGVVGAVDITAPGRLWLGRSLKNQERPELTCLFVGFLLYEPPEASEE